MSFLEVVPSDLSVMWKLENPEADLDISAVAYS